MEENGKSMDEMELVLQNEEDGSTDDMLCDELGDDIIVEGCED